MGSHDSVQATMQRLCRAITQLVPPINARLRGPAAPDDIASAEHALGLSFPRDLTSLLLCHNGQHFFDSDAGYGDPLIPMMRHAATGQRNSHYWLAGAEEVVEQTLRYREEDPWYRDEPFETHGPVRYHDRFLFVTNSENADCLVLDLLPEPGGVVGQVVLFCTQAPQLMVLAPRLETFLQSLTVDYENGRFQHSPCEYFVSYIEAA